jgi:hypothetical protein
MILVAGGVRHNIHFFSTTTFPAVPSLVLEVIVGLLVSTDGISSGDAGNSLFGKK